MISRGRVVDRLSRARRFPSIRGTDFYSGKAHLERRARLHARRPRLRGPDHELRRRRKPIRGRAWGQRRALVNPDSLDLGSAPGQVGATDFGLRLSSSSGPTASPRAGRETPGSGTAFKRPPDGSANGGLDLRNRRVPEYPQSVEGGLGIIYGPSDQHVDSRSLRRLLGLDVGAHEIKAGGGYARGRTRTGASFTGGQLVTRQGDRSGPATTSTISSPTA